MRTNLRDVSFDQIIGQAGEIVSADTRKTLALLDRMLESLKRAAADRDLGRTPVLPDEDDGEDEGDESTPGVCLNCDGF